MSAGKQRRRARRSEGGFSLIETVVAVAVIGLLSLVIYEVASFSRTGYERSLTASERFRDAEAARRLLTQLIARATPVTVEDLEGERAVFFDGRPQRLTLVAPYAAVDVPGSRTAASLAARPGLAVFSVGLEAHDGAGAALVLRHAPVATAADFTAEPKQGAITLLAAPIGASFRYFGAADDDESDDRAWMERWRLRATPPLVVSLALEGGGFSRAAPLILKPGLSAAEDAF